MLKSPIRRRLFLILLLILLVSQSFRTFATEVDKTSTVTYIVDGDTFDIANNERIRLADVDAPESGEAGYSEAKNYLSSKIMGKKVYLDVDDKYIYDYKGTGKRLVCVVYVKYNSTHRLNVNKALLVDGHAEIANFDNEFYPSTWTLYFRYATVPIELEPEPEPEPEPEAEPELEPEPESPPPSNIPPVVIMNGPYHIIVVSSVSFNSTGSYDADGEIVQFRWEFGDGTYSLKDNPVHKYMKPGNYTVTLRVTDNNGARARQTAI